MSADITRGPAFDKIVRDDQRCVMQLERLTKIMHPVQRRARSGSTTPIPLLVLFGVFVVAIVYLVASSLTRRTAPVYAASPRERSRAPDWERVGDTLTVDASDGERWQYVSLARGHVLTPPDTNGWDLAIQRYRIRAAGDIGDRGPVDFASVTLGPADSNVVLPGRRLEHWYRYNMLTHLLEPNGHLYVVDVDGKARAWKLMVLSYYCPGLSPGCLTIRYAPAAVAGREN